MAEPRLGIVLSCEHASWTTPPGVDLRVSEHALKSQAGWDHGAYEIAARLGEELGLPVHCGAFTRMFVDLNRGPSHPDVIPAVSYGEPVPGNVGLSDAQRAARLAEYHAPYWRAVLHDVQARLTDGGRCLHLSSHSFDPSLDAQARAFDVGVLYDPSSPLESQLAEALMFGLRGAGLSVRANQPYSGTAPALVTSLRGQLQTERYAGIEIEASHAVTYRAGGCAEIARGLLAAIAALRD
ncbi:MAG: N-formylglutamate amidohydrolase [Kofleriaceae bacterium]